MNLKTNTRTINENTSVIKLDGEVDVYTAPQLKQQIIGMLDNNIIHVIVNLTDVEYLDSTALGVLIGGLKRLREREGSLSLVCPNPRIRRIFEITGLDRIFDIHQTEDQALSAEKIKEGQ